MSEPELNNWKKVKEAMEANGNTDNMFYKRAVAICKGEDDPLDKLK